MTGTWSISNRGMRKFLRKQRARTTATDRDILIGNYVYTGRAIVDFASEILVDETTRYLHRDQEVPLLAGYLASNFFDWRYERQVAKGNMSAVGQGWIGRKSDLLYTLQVIDADQDEQGNYLVAGRIASFLNQTDGDLLVDEEACYYMNHQPLPLAALLRDTSYGVGIKIY